MRCRYCIDKVGDKLGVSERPAVRQAIATQSLGGAESTIKTAKERAIMA
jgi:hypothetical protein